MGYAYDSFSGYTGSGSSYRAMPPNQQASYMSNGQIGQLSSGAGLSGKQLERYQEQRAKFKKEQMEREVCKADRKKASMASGTLALLGLAGGINLGKLV